MPVVKAAPEASPLITKGTAGSNSSSAWFAIYLQSEAFHCWDVIVAMRVVMRRIKAGRLAYVPKLAQDRNAVYAHRRGPSPELTGML